MFLIYGKAGREQKSTWNLKVGWKEILEVFFRSLLRSATAILAPRWVCHLRSFSSSSSGHPILEAPESVTGPWKGDVNIPCTYGPLQGYTQVLVKWLVHRGLDPVTIFLHDSSGDHIQQAKYRGRLQVNHKIPGDVSLQLNTLEMDDRSHYTCEVTWQTPNGNQVVRDKIIELRVQKCE